MTPIPDPLRVALDPESCSHSSITAYEFTDGDQANLWACDTCRRRFYPACSSCVDVGHRNVVHPAALSAQPAPPPPDDKNATIERLTTALRVAAHSPHDQLGEPDEGFPVCSVCGAIQTAQPAPPPLDVERLRDALEGMVRQFAYWSDSAGGVCTGGLSALEYAFEVLGWSDPQPLPDRRCDEPGCMRDGTMGWPTRPGGTGPNGGYRRTCWDHSDIGKGRAALRSPDPGDGT